LHLHIAQLNPHMGLDLAQTIPVYLCRGWPYCPSSPRYFPDPVDRRLLALAHASL